MVANENKRYRNHVSPAELADDSALGEIVLSWRNKKTHGALWLPKLDERFNHRPDYRCWRNFLKLNHKYRDNNRITNCQLLEHAIEFGRIAIESDDLMIRWGGVGAVCGSLLRAYVWRHFSECQSLVLQIASSCTEIARDTERWRPCAAGCEFLDLTSHYVNEKLVNHTQVKNQRLRQDGVKYLLYVEERIKSIDPKWRPGSTASLESICKNDRVLLPFSGMQDINRYLGDALFQSRAVARDALRATSIPEVDSSEVHFLLRHSILHARSAWLTHRSQRRHITKIASALGPSAKDFGNSRTASTRAIAFDRELRALLRYGQSLFEFGDDFAAARANWIVLQFAALVESGEQMEITPELGWLIENKRLRGALNQSLDQLGIIVPGRSEPQRKGSEKVSTRQRASKPRKSESQDRISRSQEYIADEFLLSEQATELSCEANDGYKRQMEVDWLQDPDWSFLREAFPIGPKSPHLLLRHIRSIWRAICRSQFVQDSKYPQEVFRTAFRLCLRYNRVWDASWFLRRARFGAGTLSDDERHAWEVQPSDIAEFAKLVCRATAVLPVALNLVEHNHWRDRIKLVWSVVDGISDDDELFLHEAVHGCCTNISTDEMVGRSLCRQYVNANDIDLDVTDRAFGAAWKPANSTLLSDSLQVLADSSGLKVVGISVTALKDKGFSIVAVGVSGISIVKRIENVTSAEVLDALMEQFDFCTSGTADEFDSNDTNPLWTLGREILLLAERAEVDATAVLLSIDPVFASIPWNLIFRRMKSRLLVSTVPSLAWVISRRANRRNVPKFLVSDREHLIRESMSDLEVAQIDRLLDQIRQDEERLRQTLFSGVFVVGHGCASIEYPDKFRTIFGNSGPMLISSWVNVASRYDFMVVHGCLTGRVNKDLINDFSGIAGLSLLNGSKLVISPVVNISAESARTLQHHITRPHHSGTMAERYLAAMDENEDVSLYNLYGNAFLSP